MKVSDYAGLAVAGVIVYAAYKVFGLFSGSKDSETFLEKINPFVSRKSIEIIGHEERGDTPLSTLVMPDSIVYEGTTATPITELTAVQPKPYEFPIFEGGYKPTVEIGISPTVIVSPPTPAITPLTPIGQTAFQNFLSVYG